MSDRERVAKTSPDIISEQVERLRQVFPEAFAEGKVDWERLKATLGEIVDERPERYSFTWAGKQDAIRLLQTTSAATLIPCPEESVNWNTTQHLFIEGENLEVLKLLYKAYFGRVKMIYIDPPYNTGNDFVYRDNYADPLDTYLKLTEQKDAEGNLLTSNPQTSGRYHSAWLSMMYPRLFLARQLLREDGVIFVSIDDNESANLRRLLNEVFGEESFVADIVVVNNLKGRNDRKHIATAHERLLMYSRERFEECGLALPEERVAEFDKKDQLGQYRLLGLRKRGGADTRERRPRMFFPLYVDPAIGEVSVARSSKHTEEVFPRKSDGTDGCWRWGVAKVEKHISDLVGQPVHGGKRFDIFEKDYLESNGVVRRLKPKSVMAGSDYSTDGATKAFRALFSEALFTNPKPVPFMKDLVEYSTEPQEREIVLDFFAGSCTTAQAVLEINREDNGNRRFIMVQLPEPLELSKTLDDGTTLHTIADIGKERIRRVMRELKDANGGQQSLEERETPEDLGFRVFELAESNFRQWTAPESGDPKAIAEKLALFTDPFVDGWKEEDVIHEVALKEGFGLNCQVERLTGLKENSVWRVSDPDKEQTLLICLDEVLVPDDLRALNLDKEDLFICRDKALDDTLAANLALQCPKLKIL